MKYFPVINIHKTDDKEIKVLEVVNYFELDDTFKLRGVSPFCAFFDIETTGLSPKTSSIYMIGVVKKEDDKYKIIQFFAEEEKEEPEVIKRFFEELEGIKMLYHYNGQTFDIPYVKSICDIYGIALPENVQRLFDEENIDFVKMVRPLKKMLSMKSGKQKDVERWLGLDRDDEYSGGDLIPVYKHFLKTKDEEDKRLLLLHNYCDLEGMLYVAAIQNYSEFFAADTFELFKENVSQVEERIFSIAGTPDIITENSEKVAERGISDAGNLEKISEYSEKVEEKSICDASKYFEIRLTLKSGLPKGFILKGENCRVCLEGDKCTFCFPVFFTEMKYYISDYKDYYYIPSENKVIHKSLAEFIDKSLKEKANKNNCFIKVYGEFVPVINKKIAGKKAVREKIKPEDMGVKIFRTEDMMDYPDYCFMMLKDLTDNKERILKLCYMALLSEK
ncbi:MAG: ribonuclease H-like domain-containing protein [Lachnospiraceae bacterium]|nr:ribonuclease H-like domain-containing protein [Lachnospiraceae bacterium]